MVRIDKRRRCEAHSEHTKRGMASTQDGTVTEVRIALIGEEAVGKSSLLLALLEVIIVISLKIPHFPQIFSFFWFKNG